MLKSLRLRSILILTYAVSGPRNRPPMQALILLLLWINCRNLLSYVSC